ncbi:MAG: penicillin-binding transpeptidase domain-containing protein [Actinomycetota bacterium]
MNSQIRRVGLVVLVMFGVLFVNLNYIQLVKAEKLANHPRNRRLLLAEYAIERGAILSADQITLARSEPTPKAALKYLRTYDTAELFAHAVGYYSVRFGREGLERTHNKELSGKGGVLTIQDIGDRFLKGTELGDTLILSLDSRVQRAALESLDGHKGAIVALDPITGQVLAMVSLPSFNPNPLSQHSSTGQEETYRSLLAHDDDPLVNRATRRTYPPGSTFKLVTAIAALQNGRGVDTTFPATEAYTPAQTSTSIRNFGGANCGGSMAEAMRDSCNTYFARLGAELPKGALEETATALGFTQVPPIDLPALASELPTTAQLKSPAFAAQSAIGQFEVAATPLQMALVAAAIANGGKVPEPQLVREVQDARGAVVKQTKPRVWRDAFSKETADALKQMMIAVVDSGTGRSASISGVKVAGKTGTAQAGTEGSGTFAWFVAFAPADAPRIAIAIVVEGAGDPKNETGGRLAAPMAKKVLEAHRRIAGW